MITKLVLRNFKSIAEQVYSFTNLDLLVGRNNCGKSTILQALAIWQFSIDEFHRAKRRGSTGKQVVLPNFTALPLPEFNLLWRERTDRKYPIVGTKKKQEYILIEIEVTWQTPSLDEHVFGVKLRYNSPQSVYAIPSQGWDKFRELEKTLPSIAYVPPFSGLEPIEEWRDDGPIRKQVGKAQPGSVLRNLLLRVCPPPPKDEHGHFSKVNWPTPEWNEIKTVTQRWFSVELKEPKYERGVDTQILCEYKEGKQLYDIIAAGSGFHQTLTLLAFLYGYKPNTILLDEPDAHLHVNLQREILDYFKSKSAERHIQFIIATHAEELIKGVDACRVVSLLQQAPIRESSTPDILAAMADVSNVEITQLRAYPFVLYVEGENDERILRAWARTLRAEDVLGKLCFITMGGGSKQLMKEDAERHFKAVKQIIPDTMRLMVFDYDSDETAFHPQKGNEVLFEWKRKNIENYLMVPESWKRAVGQVLGAGDDLLVPTTQPALRIIDDFFLGENLTRPPNKTWATLDANVFRVVNGKEILFNSEKSLFNQLRQTGLQLSLTREMVAGAMLDSEMHNDVKTLFDKIRAVLGTDSQ